MTHSHTSENNFLQ